MDGFYTVIPPQTWTDLDETWNISEDSWCALTQKLGEIAQGVLSMDAKTCFILFVSPIQIIQHGLSATFLHRFWAFLKEKTWIGVRMRKPLTNFRISAQVPKTTGNEYFWGAVYDRGTAQMAEFWAMGIISGTSRHHKDVLFVSEFWWRFGRYKPTITNSGYYWRRCFAE